MLCIDLRLGSMGNDWIATSDGAFLPKWQSEVEIWMKFEWMNEKLVPYSRLIIWLRAHFPYKTTRSWDPFPLSAFVSCWNVFLVISMFPNLTHCEASEGLPCPRKLCLSPAASITCVTWWMSQEQLKSWLQCCLSVGQWTSLVTFLNVFHICPEGELPWHKGPDFLL